MFGFCDLEGGPAKRSAETKTRRGFWRVHDIGLALSRKSFIAASLHSARRGAPSYGATTTDLLE
jgi:hypothetical protein